MKSTSPWITYRTRFLVQAKQLATSITFTDALGRQHSGRKGDYLVESSDGVLRIAPRQIFEDIYVPLAGEPSAVESGFEAEARPGLEGAAGSRFEGARLQPRRSELQIGTGALAPNLDLYPPSRIQTRHWKSRPVDPVASLSKGPSKPIPNSSSFSPTPRSPHL
jgi:hypothetical protein